MSLRESIKAIVLAGGTPSFPYKEKIQDWFVEVKLTPIEPDFYGRHLNRRFISYGILHIDTEDIDDAVSKYCSFLFSRKNIGLAYEGIRRHRMSEVEFEDLSSQKMTALIRKYFSEHYPTDYPDFPIEMT